MHNESSDELSEDQPTTSCFLVKPLTMEGMNVDEVRYTLEN